MPQVGRTFFPIPLGVRVLVTIMLGTEDSGVTFARTLIAFERQTEHDRIAIDSKYAATTTTHAKGSTRRSCGTSPVT